MLLSLILPKKHLSHLNIQKNCFHASTKLSAGHSHWSNIAKHKARTDLAKAKQFTKISQEIKMSVKLAKNGDPKENPRLATALQKAKAVNFPKEKIEDLINRGLGKGSANSFEVTYEVYGPHRVAIICDVITDNKNRSLSAIRHWASKRGGSVANAGSFDFLFKKTGIVHFNLTGKAEDDAMAIAMEQGAEDVVFEEEGEGKIFCEPDEDLVWNIQEALEANQFEVLEATVIKVPQTTATLDSDQRVEFEQSLDSLYDAEPDIQNLYHNAEYIE